MDTKAWLGTSAAMLAAALTAGCSGMQSPREIVQTGQRFDFQSAKPARDAANCIERNASEIRWGLLRVTYNTTMVDGLAPGTHEVRYHQDGAALAVAIASPAARGSAISVWMAEGDYGILRGEGTLAEQLTRGC